MTTYATGYGVTDGTRGWGSVTVEYPANIRVFDHEIKGTVDVYV